MAETTIRDGRDLTTHLTATLAAGAGTDRTAICLVRCPADREVQRSVTSAVQTGVPAAALYDLGGGELAAVGPPGFERALARSLRQLRRAGVSWGTALWPADGDDPAVVLDTAASRVGRRSRRHWVRRGVQVGAAMSLVVTVLVPLMGADGRPAEGSGGTKTVRLVGEDAPGASTTNARATSSAQPHVLPQSPAPSSAPAEAVAGGRTGDRPAVPAQPAAPSASRPAGRAQPAPRATPAAAPPQTRVPARERPQGPAEQPREETRGPAVESGRPNGDAQPDHEARPQPSQEPPAPAAPAQEPPAPAAPPPAEEGDRRAEERRRDEQRRAEEQRRDDARRAEEARRNEEARRAEEVRRNEEARRAEEVRRNDEAPGRQAERRQDGDAGRRNG